MSYAPPRLEIGLIESFIEALPDGCLVVDQTGHILGANRRWRELPRQARAVEAARNPLGVNYLELYRFSVPNERLERAVEGIKSVLEGISEQYEHEYIRVDEGGSFRWFRMTVRAWPQVGSGAIITHRDISAEKLFQVDSAQVQQEFRMLADSAPAMIWMCGPDMKCIFVNRAWREFTGAPVEDALGDGVAQFVHPDDHAALMKAFQNAFEQKNQFEHEYRMRHWDGGYRWVRDHGAPRLDMLNKLSGFTGALWDLSDQKRASRRSIQSDALCASDTRCGRDC